MKSINTVTSDTIRMARFPLAIFVVFIHSVGGGTPYFQIRDFISHPLLSFVVPTFFIISGYLFYFNTIGKDNSSWYKSKLKKRIKTLLIPYIIWNTITLGLDILKYFKKSSCWLSYESMNFIDILYETFVDYMPINLPLWYVRDLIILVIFSPFIKMAIERYLYIFFFIIILWYFFANSFIINPVSILFFSIGCLTAIRQKDFIPNINVNLIMPVLSFLIVIMFLTNYTFIQKTYALIMPFTFLLIVKKLSYKQSLNSCLSSMSKYSEIIYYSHYPITLILAVKIIACISLENSLVIYFITPVIAVILSIYIQILLNKISKLFKIELI